MRSIEFIFWTSFAVLFFCYAGYGLLLFVFNKVKGFFISGRRSAAYEWPPVTLVIAAYNEKQVLEAKIRNCLAIEYPQGKLKFVFITDGSSDGSERLMDNYPSILCLHQQERRGKLAAIKRAMQFVETPIVIFSDANTLLNKECVQRIMLHYQDTQTGGVAGEKKIRDHKKVSAVGEAEGLYWEYESFMKKQDALFHTVVGAAGELFSIRTELFRELDEGVILDDFLISMQVCLQGYKITYEPGAYAIESPSVSLAEEEKRKVRISAGAYQSVGYLMEVLNVFKFPVLSFQYISRRLLRWIFCPLLLPVLLVTNFLLVNELTAPVYTWILYAQLFFYLMVLPGWLLLRSGKKAGFFAVPFYFVFMNYCLVKGFIRFMKGRQSVLWEKSLRQAPS